MALSLSLRDGTPLQTSVAIPVPAVYVQIERLNYDKDAFDADLHVRYFVDAPAAQRKMPVEEVKNGVIRTVMRASAGFSVAGLPHLVTVADPLGLLASPTSNAYVVAYALLKEALEAAVPTALVVNA